ncbi:glycosyltransferase 87 family protein [Candidatus Palauibacter sp.]|uniref:glycosyltransferase 87 family protein n=1 Tax=Candidatus Palauibacter sp. TaxID=3101350 RepID=UPI003AF2B683
MWARWIWALVAVEAAALWTMAWGGSGTPFPAVALWSVAFMAYVLAARCAVPASGAAITRRRIWTAGVVLRAGVFPAAPTLSEDIYRYMWDGWVQRNGVNPYAHPPASPILEGLRTEWWPLINHADVPTIYPPGAQFVFALLAWIGPGWWIFKLGWLAADLVVARLVDRLSRDRSPLPLLLYLLSPLLVVEVAWSGHLDPLGIAPMLGAVALAAGVSIPAWRAGALLGIGASLKFAPIAGLPALARRRGPWAVAAALAAPILLYLPYVGAGSSLFDGLRVYADLWEFNAGLYNVLERLPGHPDLPKWIGAAVVGGVAMRAALHRWPLDRALFWAIGAALLLSPTLHPWYVLWVLPFACLSVSRGWLLLSGTVFLAYAGRDVYLATGVWPEPVWLGWVVHGPPLALLAWDRWRGRHPQGLAGGERVAGSEQTGKRHGGRQPE